MLRLEGARWPHPAVRQRQRAEHLLGRLLPRLHRAVDAPEATPKGGQHPASEGRLKERAPGSRSSCGAEEIAS
eukprot:6189886-Prymnesium_polylepis.1